MPEFAPRAKETSRGRHPDLDDNGELRDDVDLPRGEQAFRRMWSDEARRSAFMGQIAREQAQLPADVQRSVAGQQYGGADAYRGWLEYLSHINDIRSYSPGEVTGADIAGMSLEEYDKLFDVNGKPREGVTYSPGGRDVDVLSQGVDPFSQQEFRSKRA